MRLKPTSIFYENTRLVHYLNEYLFPRIPSSHFHEEVQLKISIQFANNRYSTIPTRHKVHMAQINVT